MEFMKFLLPGQIYQLEMQRHALGLEFLRELKSNYPEDIEIIRGEISQHEKKDEGRKARAFLDDALGYFCAMPGVALLLTGRTDLMLIGGPLVATSLTLRFMQYSELRKINRRLSNYLEGRDGSPENL